MTSESTKLRPWSGDRAPASWGLGDGQAIPWEYAPAPESRDIVRLKERYGLFIDGRAQKQRNSELLATDNVKRIVRRPAGVSDARFDWLDDRAAERRDWIAAYLEMKTVWHPIGV